MATEEGAEPSAPIAEDRGALSASAPAPQLPLSAPAVSSRQVPNTVDATKAAAAARALQIRAEILSTSQPLVPQAVSSQLATASTTLAAAQVNPNLEEQQQAYETARQAKVATAPILQYSAGYIPPQVYPAELETNPELEAIRAVLNISYDGLPYHLKSCFLYLSIFPEDDKISRKRLVRRWCAEGYSRELWDKSAEEIANNYFFELIDRSMILSTQNSTYSSRGADSCQIHDIMREIAILKSKEENLVLRLEGGRRLHNHDTVRHLSITNSSEDWETDVGELKTTVDMSRIRSLTVFGEWRPFFISDKMRLLRVLDLEDTEGVRNHHIKQIGELLHLRYLSLRGCMHIAYLPDSLGNLRQLETLDVRASVIVKFDTGINTRDICCLFCCGILPSIAMRLQGNGVVAPRGLRRLTALHTLGVVDISWQPSILQDIKRLTHLRKLEVTGVNKKNSKKFLSALAALSRLESLSLISKGKLGLWGCLDAEEKFSPPKDLKSLKLHGNLVELPKWIGKLNNLVKLKLSEIGLKDHDAAIQVLGKLRNLSIHCLPRKSFHSLEGGELNFSEGSFKSLVVLKLHFGGSKCVKFQQGAFHDLELLVLSGYIEEVGTKFSGLEFLPRIKEVQLHDYFYDVN
uniref:Leucine Rich Repeat family protein n=1 Tax=Oryza sativa subsp. japonica TaxID=39947 RepID=Q2QNN4_ORYSJ|nr:Leucine Rich Repeat family protein [Oryza sativa Japonica Group]